MTTFKKFFIVTIILFTILSFSQFVIAQSKVGDKFVEIQMQRIGGIRAGVIVALISDGGAWVGTEDGGVCHYSVDGKIVQFTTKNGLGQTFVILSPDGKLAISGYDQLDRQYCSYLGAVVEIQNGEYKFDGLPINEEFNIYVTQDNLTNGNNADSEKLVISDSIFIKDKTFKTTETTFSAKSKSQTGQVIIVRKLPMKWVEYDFAGRVIASYDEKKDQTLYIYDSLGRLIAVVQPPAGEDNTRLARENYFDPAGNLIAQILVPFEKDTLKPIEKKKRITRMEHDSIGRTTKIIQPNPQTYGECPTTLHEFALSGNLIKRTDPLNNSTTFSYDNLNRKISETNAEGGVTTFEYDSVGRMMSLTDPVGNTTSWSYNLLGKVSRERIVIDGVTNIRYFFYDSAGNIVRKIDRDKRVTEWTFDGLNRHTSEIWYDTSKSWLQKTPSKKITTTYNNRGKIESIDDGDSKFTFAYGIFGNEIKQTQNLAGFEKPIEFNFATDINGFNTEKIVKVDGQIDHKNKYEVDALNRVSNISQTTNNSETKSVDIQYDNLGQLTTQTRLDSGKPIIVTKNKFDTAGRLFNISHTGNGKIYADYDTWDNANRITDFDFTYLNGPAKKSESKYLYDKTSQIISVSYNFMPNERYDFDLNGNRKQAEIQGQKQTYKTSQYNRLLSDENYSYEYDREGNRISKTAKNGTITKYFWDNRNRLIKVQTPTETIEYIYDYLNRLVKRTHDKNETLFVHDGWQIILQFDNKNRKPTHRYLWGTKQDELICDNNNWILGDHLNTVRDIVKSDGNIESHLEYNSFGKLVSETKNTALTYFAYTGKLTDKSSNLQWNINRWYDSNVGRWVSEDPIGFRGRDVNLVRYIKNLSSSMIDSFGLLAKKFQYDAYIKNWNWPFPTTHTVHMKYDVTLECCGPKVLIRDSNGPTIVVNKLDEAQSAGPTIIDFAPAGQNRNTGKIINWGGGATEGDMPGWTYGAGAGGVIGALIIPIPPADPSDAILVPVGTIIGGLFGGIYEMIFDDEIAWFFSWKITAYCELAQYGNAWVLNVSSSRTEEYRDNDWDDFYTDYTESSVFVMPN
jgi:RHS repeat-associated protein